MRVLVGDLVDEYLRVDKVAGRFMALVVEKNCGREGFEAVYSFSHYGQLNGDLIFGAEERSIPPGM